MQFSPHGKWFLVRSAIIGLDVDCVDIISTTGHHAGIAKRSNILLVQQLCCHDGTLILVTRKVHRSSFMRLVCYAEDHFISLTLLILLTPSTCVCVCVLCVRACVRACAMLSIHSILVCAAASLFCACMS